jgi:hypothetical protein
MQIVAERPFGYHKVNQIQTNQERQIMKNVRFFTFVLILGALVLSACGAAAATPTPVPAPITAGGSPKAEAMPVAFVGVVDSIAGDQWVISGTTVTVAESVVRDGPFHVGDRVKVEGQVHADGSFTISRVEAPTPQETATLPPVSVDNSNDASIDANSNDASVNDGNINDDSSTGLNSNDDNSNDSNTNDDNGGNTNDDNGVNDNGDDNGGDRGNDNGDDNGGNSNDDNSGGGGGNDDSGGDDKGSGGNGSDD